MGASPMVCDIVGGATFSFRELPQWDCDCPNHKSFLDNVIQATQQLLDNVKSGVIETQEDVLPEADPLVPHPDFVTVVNPLGCTGKKDSSEVRPDVDPSITGVNLAMDPMPLHLPTVEQLLPLLRPGYVLAKRDWRHGFHNLTLAPSSHKYMGLWLPDGRICHFKALPFGASQAPALFTTVSNEFARLLY